MKLLVLNGPNLNLLGTRETDIYGKDSLADLEADLTTTFPNVAFTFAQSNSEGGLIDRLHAAEQEGFTGIIMNPAGYTHTSVALHDAIAPLSVPVVEVHISNVHRREAFRHKSLTAAACAGQIVGFGLAGYHLAVKYFTDLH